MNDKTVADVHWSFWAIGAVVAQIPFLGMAGFPVEAWIGWSSQLVVGAFFVWYSKRAESKGWIS